VVHFFQRAIKLISGETEQTNLLAEAKSFNLTFETNTELQATCIPEGTDSWITVTLKPAGNVTSLTYEVKANTTSSAREGFIVVTPKDNPGYEVVKIHVTQKEG
jgi:hypothetical protein